MDDFLQALQAQADHLAARRAEGVALPDPEVLRNSGAHRTTAKRRLLDRLARLAARQGRKAPFPARWDPLDLDGPGKAPSGPAGEGGPT